MKLPTNKNNTSRPTRTGVDVRPHMIDYFIQCKTCGYYEWHKIIIGNCCPICALKRPSFKLEISFGYSKSKSYKKAVREAKKFPTYTEVDNIHKISFETLNDYSGYHNEVDDLVLITTWKSFSAKLNGESVTAYQIRSISGEITRMCKLNNAIAVIFEGNEPIFILPSEEL